LTYPYFVYYIIITQWDVTCTEQCKTFPLKLRIVFCFHSCTVPLDIIKVFFFSPTDALYIFSGVH